MFGRFVGLFFGFYYFVNFDGLIILLLNDVKMLFFLYKKKFLILFVSIIIDFIVVLIICLSFERYFIFIFVNFYKNI